jgi:hypothetical protein
MCRENSDARSGERDFGQNRLSHWYSWGTTDLLIHSQYQVFDFLRVCPKRHGKAQFLQSAMDPVGISNWRGRIVARAPVEHHVPTTPDIATEAPRMEEGSINSKSW